MVDLALRTAGLIVVVTIASFVLGLGLWAIENPDAVRRLITHGRGSHLRRHFR